MRTDANMLVPVQLPPGIVRANTPYDTPGSWWDTNLVRWKSGTLLPIGGNQRITGTPLDSSVRKLHIFRDNSNSLFTLVGTTSKLWLSQSGFADITPAGLVSLSTIGVYGGYGTFGYGVGTYGTHRPQPSPFYSPYAYWTFANWGQDVILTNNADGRLFYYASSTPTTAPTVISTAPIGNGAVLVTNERYVLAVGQTGGGGTLRRVAWSSREDYSDWNFASTTNTAGYQDLPTRTPLLKGVGVREGVLIFSYSEAYLAQFVGQPYNYGFTYIGDTEMFNPDSVATFNGKAVWPSRTGFQLYSGGFIQPLPCPFWDEIVAEMDPLYGPFGIHGCDNGAHPEIWWFYATVGNTTPNRYVIWNYQENWWAWGYMSRTAMAPGEVYQYPIMGDADGNVFQHEVGYTDSGVTRVGQVYAETGALGLGNGDQGIEISQALPATGTGATALRMQFFTRMAPEGAERTFGPYTPRADGYTDVRVSGREARMRFVAAQDGPFGVGKMRFDVASGPGR